ncbi:MAG: bifunctional (p)ppGpp synthetase/guanosine-3',5'-bis(diphosphate) 3'-pyrophosphohydrolase [Nitrospirae bacterium]|nr:bifunctional (p)ppGpp synthetase/guanosine-3',5'-bis(diphosphate) 3'-pyrophosphohydrolase [Nitrospirota bacterium]MBF0540626.1 bifunctional (p)ppGpp synthetase/guanosine-3',5'-bis(diphosphate) 3'-pyrophosphohydrolase [Nitrospirota bacterium]
MAAISITLQDLIEKVTSYAPDADKDLLRKAWFFTNEAHCNQKRKEGTRYFEHPIFVASTLADLHLDVSTIIAGLLHDTVEDTDTSIEDISGIFGEDVAFMVDALTKLDKIEFTSREEAQAESFRKMLLAMAKDIRVIMIKFADRLHNMRTLEHLAPESQKRIATETLEVYAPLANRLGIGWLKLEFEDMGFKFLHPELYEELSKKLFKKREEQEDYIKNFTITVENKLKENGISAEVSGRVKHFYGIFKKMKSQRITFEEVYDIFGLRVIVTEKTQCYAVLGLIHSLWIPVPGRFKDYIALPKSNMYQSLHTTVLGPKGERVEFQIRTLEMHRIAEEGIASHWLYKEKNKIEDKDTKYIKWLRELVSSQNDLKDATEFLELFKGEVLSDVVYVLTPTAQIKELPRGSTTVDFAYAVHTQIGNKCAGARINGRIVPLRYELHNGDTVEIITAQRAGPSKDWLNFVVTQKAKTRIRQWINIEERKQGIDLGIKILEVELRKQGIRPSKGKSAKMEETAKLFNYKSLDDLLIAIGYGRVPAHQVVAKFNLNENTALDIPIISKFLKNIGSHKGIKITGIDNMLHNTAKCCYPIPGDSLVGYVTRGKGVTIHRKECPNILRFTSDERVVDVSWDMDDETTSQAKLFVETVDKPGILASLSALISSLKINLHHLQATTSQNKHAYFILILEVKNISQLTSLKNKMMSVDGVINVSRHGSEQIEE